MGILAAIDSSAVSAVASAIAGLGAAATAVLMKLDRADDRRALRRANVVGMFVRDADSDWLQVQNHGPATAENVSLSIDPVPANLKIERFPTTLVPGQVIALDYNRVPYTPASDAHLTWSDENGDAESIAIPSTPVPLRGLTYSDVIRSARAAAALMA